MNFSLFNSSYGLPIEIDTSFIIHQVSAIISSSLSLFCVITVIFHRFYKSSSNFYTWSPGDRFVIYLALCAGFFSVVSFSDHLQTFLTEDHINPHELCVLHGFLLVLFSTSQYFLANTIAVNAILLLCFNTQISFGKYDVKLLMYVFGVPLLAGIIIGFAGHYGPAFSV